MPQHFGVEVHSNIDALSARVLHAALVATVDQTLSGAEGFLRADRAPHTRRSQGGATIDHIRRERAKDLVDLVEGKLGITSVVEKDKVPTHGLYRHSQAPIFVEGGTHSPIFSSHLASPRREREGTMRYEDGGNIFFRKKVRGQRGQHFMARTYAEAQLILRADPSVGLALDAMAAEAAAMKPTTEA